MLPNFQFTMLNSCCFGIFFALAFRKNFDRYLDICLLRIDFGFADWIYPAFSG